MMNLDKLYSILNDLQQHKRSKDEFMKDVVNNRLEDSFNSYYKELNNASEYIYRRNVDTVVRKIKNDNKYCK